MIYHVKNELNFHLDIYAFWFIGSIFIRSECEKTTKNQIGLFKYK